MRASAIRRESSPPEGAKRLADSRYRARLARSTDSRVLHHFPGTHEFRLTHLGAERAMSRSSKSDSVKRNAQGYFNQSQKRDELLKAELEKGRNAEKDKIARLRALRMERETNPVAGGDAAAKASNS